MNITLLNYASHGYKESRADLKATALNIAGVSKVIEYNTEDIDEDFKRTYAKHFCMAKGAGYWLWKPYLILKTLDTLLDGDVCVYCDAGSYFTDSLIPYIQKMSGSIMLFKPAKDWSTKEWTKMDVLEHFHLENCTTGQLEAGFILLKKSDISIRFIKEWLELCKDYHYISDEPSLKPNASGFKEHRHDQSLLSCLAMSCGAKDIYNIDIETKPFIVHHRGKQ